MSMSRFSGSHSLKYHAFFWDYDGTLMDTYPLMCDILRDLARASGWNMEMPELLSLMKHSLTTCLSAISEKTGEDRDVLLRRFREEELLRQSEVRLMPGTAEVLRTLRDRGGRHFLVTHRDALALRRLRELLPDCPFEDSVISDLGFPRKPDPACLEYLLSRHRLDPRDALMTGDRPLDTQCGHRAGTAACLLDSEERFPQEPCDIRIRDLKELLQHVM